MATVIRPEISEKNKYYIDKHRYYELKHFCLQYPIWKKACLDIDGFGSSSSVMDGTFSKSIPVDVTSKYAMLKSFYTKRIELIEQAAMEADEGLYEYILKAVTEGFSYPYLKTKMNIPCGKDMYYDRYRRFFWLLSEARD